MPNKSRNFLKNSKIPLNIFLIYFFLTFVMGYLDFDRRVESFEYSTECLRKVVSGEFAPPMAHRILVPYAVYYFHRLSGIPLAYSFAFFRFIFFFLAFVLFHIYLRHWFDNKMAMIGTLSLMASLPLTLTNWYCVPTDMPELICFILAAMWIIDGKYGYLYFLIPIAAMNRETSIVFVLLYFLHDIGKEKNYIFIRRTAVYILLWLVPSALLIKFFGGIREVHTFFFNAGYNINGLLEIFRSPNPYNHYYFLFYLCGFYWILAFKDFRYKDVFLKKALIVMLPLFIYTFLRAGGINEVRIFIPFYTFVIPLGLFSLFPKGER